jgi:hypothetical protein
MSSGLENAINRWTKKIPMTSPQKEKEKKAKKKKKLQEKIQTF